MGTAIWHIPGKEMTMKPNTYCVLTVLQLLTKHLMCSISFILCHHYHCPPFTEKKVAAETYFTLGRTDSMVHKSLSTNGCANHLAQCLETGSNYLQEANTSMSARAKSSVMAERHLPKPEKDLNR